MGGQHSKREGPNGSPSSSSTRSPSSSSSKILRNWSFPTKSSPKRFTSSTCDGHGVATVAVAFGQRRYMCRNGLQAHKNQLRSSSENCNQISIEEDEDEEPIEEEHTNFIREKEQEEVDVVVVVDNVNVITTANTRNHPWSSKRLRTSSNLDATRTTTDLSFQSQEKLTPHCGVRVSPPSCKENDKAAATAAAAMASFVERMIADNERITADDDDGESRKRSLGSEAFSWGLLSREDSVLGLDDSACLWMGSDQQQEVSIAKGNSPPLPPRQPMRSLRKLGQVRASTTPPGRRRRAALRASLPKPMSSLESCLSAQTLDDSDPPDRASSSCAAALDWPLNFPSVGIERERRHDVKNDVCVECCNAGTHLDLRCELGFRVGDREHARSRRSSSAGEKKTCVIGKNGTAPFLCSTTSRSPENNTVNKKPRIRQFFSTSSSDLGINKTNSQGWTERLIFAIGVSVGAMVMVHRSNAEVTELHRLLAEAQEQVQSLMHELKKLGGSGGGFVCSERERAQTQCQLFMAGGGKLDGLSGGKDDAGFGTGRDLLSAYDSESALGVPTVKESLLVKDEFSDDETHMAELEAELEAELDRLTGHNLVHVEDDGEVDIVYGGLSIEDLPEQFKRINDDEDDKEFKDPKFVHEFFDHETAVSPRELTCLLHNLQATRQQELITELEEELDNLQRQLEIKDSELELWKSGIRRLSKNWTPESPTPGNDEVLSLMNPIFEKTTHPDDNDDVMDDDEVDVKTPEVASENSRVLPCRDSRPPEGASSEQQPSRLFVTPVAPMWRENWIWNHQQDVHSAEEDSVDDLENEDLPQDKSSPEFDENVCDEFLQALVDCGGGV